jgi:tRNA A37 threonylcarbamoyltransferase TsaD
VLYVRDAIPVPKAPVCVFCHVEVGVGIVKYSPATGEYTILSNPRKTFIPPPGHGFLPRETAWHHQQVRIPRLGVQR